MKSLHLLALLLQYPGKDLQSVAGEIRQRIEADPALPGDAAARLDPLLARLASCDIYEAQET